MTPIQEIEQFCRETLGMKGQDTTSDIMRRVIVEAIQKWEARSVTAPKQSHAELQTEWTDQFGDHSECPVCGTACEMLYMEGK